MSIDVPFTKENLEGYLKELAKEYKKRGRGMPAEMILVGGASVLINYQFRAASYDIDASYESPAIMKEAINSQSEKNINKAITKAKNVDTKVIYKVSSVASSSNFAIILSPL